ncbi:carboxypeptidase-like regulatory domain-containing protein [Leptobacterium sp. I13]|uniref:TonB-dependent receptor n=1 Tax=Leptobacterium meishanense TaxID=3128904 RepID=UPI0030EF02D9
MQNRVLFKTTLLLFVFLTSFSAISQTNEEREEPLSIVLSKIETIFDVKFSYQDATIEGVYIIPLKEFTTLDAALASLKKATFLDFDKVDERFIAITKSINSVETICGTVRDIKTNTVLTGASIQILNGIQSAISDDKGGFTFKNIPIDAILIIKYLGYEPVEISVRRFVQQGNCSAVYMLPKTQQLDEVVIVNYLTRGVNQKIDGSITLTPLDFGILPGLSEPDVLQTIQALPGIESVDETISNINIRGGTHDQNLILWDGIKMYHTGHFFGLISVFNPYLTEDVDVIKNGTSAMYNDGVSSTINMQTRNQVAEKFSGGAGFNLLGGDFYAMIPLGEGWSFQASARRSFTDYITTPTFEEFFQRSFQDTEVIENGNTVERDLIGDEKFLFYDYTAKLLFDPSDDDEVRLSFININNELSYEEFGLNTNSSETSSLNQTNLGIGGNWKRKWSRRLSTELSGYYTRYNIDAVNFDVDNAQRLIQENEVMESGVKLTSEYVNNNIAIQTGYQYYEVGATSAVDVNNPTFIQITKDVLRNHALFNEITYSNDRTYARIGGRLNYAEKFGKFIVEPRLNVNQKLTETISVKVQGEVKSQFISQVIDLQEDFLGIDNRRWLLTNEEELPIITSMQGSVGFDYNHQGWLVSLEAYYKKVDGITTQSQGFQDQNQFVNTIGEYHIKGLEFLINKKTNWYSTWLTYSLAKNDYTFAGLSPSIFPNNADIRHSVTFAGTYRVNRLKLAVGVNWRSGKPFTQPLGNDPINEDIVPVSINYESPNAENLDDFLRADVSAIYNFPLGNKVSATLGASVLNVLNKKNTLNTYYRIAEGPIVQQLESQSLGITPNISFRIKF